MTGLLVAALLSLGAAKLPQGADLQAGVRVRVRVEGAARGIAGSIAGADSRRLTLALPGAQLGIPWRSISELSASRGSGAGRGAARGALFGGVIALGSALAQKGHVEEESFLGGLIAFPLGGIIVGSAAGALIAREGWRPVVFDPSLREGTDSVDVTFVWGEKVRLYLADGVRSGMIEQRSRDTLFVHSSAGVLPVPRRAVEAVRVRGGKNRAVGALIGFVIGGVLVLASGEPLQDATRNAVLNASVMVGGGLLGSRFFAPRTWATLPLPRR